MDEQDFESRIERYIAYINGLISYQISETIFIMSMNNLFTPFKKALLNARSTTIVRHCALFVVLLLFLSSMLDVRAQVTIRRSDLAGAGDTARISIGSTFPSTLFNPSGPQLTVNVDTLTPIRQVLDTLLRPRDTPFALFFRNASYGQGSDAFRALSQIGGGAIPFENPTDFYRLNDTSLSIVGIGVGINGLPLPTFYTEPELIARLPISFGQAYTDSFNFSLSIPGLPFGLRRSGSKSFLADGWGTVTTPYGSFECVKLVVETVHNDTVLIPLGPTVIPFPIRYNSTDVRWYAPGEKVPILQLTRSSLPPGGLSIRYKDINRQPKARLSGDTLFGCSPFTAALTHTSANADSIIWELSNGFRAVQGRNDDSLWASITAAGQLDLRLIAVNRLGRDTLLRPSFIYSDSVRVDFEADFTEVDLDDAEIQFQNRSFVKFNEGVSYDYAWNFGDDSTSNEMNPVHRYQREDSFDVQLIVRSSAGCVDTLTKRDYILVTGPTSVAQIVQESNAFRAWVYPNPISSQSELTFVAPTSTNTQVQIYSVSGQELYSYPPTMWPAGTHKLSLPTHLMPSGRYLLRINNESGHQTIPLIVP